MCEIPFPKKQTRILNFKNLNLLKQKPCFIEWLKICDEMFCTEDFKNEILGLVVNDEQKEIKLQEMNVFGKMQQLTKKEKESISTSNEANGSVPPSKYEFSDYKKTFSILVKARVSEKLITTKSQLKRKIDFGFIRNVSFYDINKT